MSLSAGAFVSDLPVLDPQPLQDLLDLGAEDGLVRELIGLYQEDVPGRLTALRTAAAEGDLRHILAEAHQLKGALGNLGLLRFADLARRIEAEARTGALDEAPGLIGELPRAYDEALAALNAAFPAA